MGTHEKPGISRRELLKHTWEVTQWSVAATAGAYIFDNGVHILNEYRHNEIPPSLPSSVDTSSLPERLPPAVAAMQFAVVNVIAYGNPDYFLSGIILDSTHVLSAGHGFRTDSDQSLPSVGCREGISIIRRDSKGKLTIAKSTRVVSSYEWGNYSIPDVALIETDGPIGNSYNIPRISLRSTPVKKGEPLFFINYETTSQGDIRSPAAINTRLQSPAMYGGIAFTTWNGDIAVRLGERSYGGETTIHEEASGGGVFDENGYLVGISNKGAFSGMEGIVKSISNALLNRLYKSIIYRPDACTE